MKIISTKKQRKLVSSFMIIGFLLAISYIPIWNEGLERADIVCLLSFLLNSVVFIWGMFSAQRRYSISMELVYWIFMFFFMYFAPLIQYLSSTYPWHGTLTDEDVLTTNILIFVFNVFFVMGEMVARRVRIKGVSSFGITEFLCEKYEFGKKTKILMSIIVGILTIYSLSRTGLFGVIVSRVQATKVFYSGSSSSIELIVESVIPAFFAYTVVEAAQSMISEKKGYIRFLFLILCLLICFFPTSLPRYKTVTIYGALFLVLLPRLKNGSKFFWLFFVAFIVVFPLLNGFRHIISMESIQSVFKDGFTTVYVKADYDAYRMLSSAIEFTKQNGSQWGFQLLGSLLFFVPRVVWKTKPGGSGAMLIRAEFGNDTVSNVSCPFIAEGYLNFGFAGIVLFALFLGTVISKVDKAYWKANMDKPHIVFSPYLFMLFMIFFVMRGDLLSGFAYLCGFIVTGYFIMILEKYIG